CLLSCKIQATVSICLPRFVSLECGRPFLTQGIYGRSRPINPHSFQSTFVANCFAHNGDRPLNKPKSYKSLFQYRLISLIWFYRNYSCSQSQKQVGFETHVCADVEDKVAAM